MRRCAKYFACMAVAAFVFARMAGAQSGTTAPTADTPKKDYVNVIPIPVGENAIDSWIPYWEGGKVKTMLIHVHLIEHKDPEHVQMTNAKIITYDDKKQTDMILLLPVSVLDLRTRLLTTDKPFVMKKTDFELMGDSLELDTETRRATITGKVKMIIYNFEDPSKKEPAHE
jgi:hypothetical protein